MTIEQYKEKYPIHVVNIDKKEGTIEVGNLGVNHYYKLWEITQYGLKFVEVTFFTIDDIQELKDIISVFEWHDGIKN
jgi:hypothetical protein